MEGSFLIKDGHTLGGNSLKLELTPGMISPDMVHQIPLLAIGGVAVNAVELLYSVVNLFVGSEGVGPGEELAADVTGEVPEAIVNCVDVALK